MKRTKDHVERKRQVQCRTTTNRLSTRPLKRHFPRTLAPTRLPKRQVHGIPTAHPRSPRWASQDGSASAELTIAVPALMVLIVLAVQFALWQHASAVTKAAAQEGVRAARMEGGSAMDGEAEARSFLSQAAPRIVVAPSVSARRSAAEARVEVTGGAIALLPWIRLPVHAVAASPVEEYRIPRVGP